MKSITIYADGKQHSLDEIFDVLSDNYIDDGGVCNQTVIDLRDALQYVVGRCKAMEKLYNYAESPPCTALQLGELMELRRWYNDCIREIQS